MKQEDMTFKGRGGWSMGAFGGESGNGEIIYLTISKIKKIFLKI